MIDIHPTKEQINTAKYLTEKYNFETNFNIKDNEQCHHQSNGKSCGCNINRCKKPVLFH